METSRVINFTSIADIEANIDNFKYIFATHGVICLRGANLDDAGHEELTYMLGDHLKFFPNNSNKAPGTYKEDHSSLIKKTGEKPKDEVLLYWHQEHIDRKRTIVSGIWNMHTFRCQTGVGNTLFVDMAKMYNSLSEEERNFFKKSTISMNVYHPSENKANDDIAYVTPVQSHWLTKENTLRLDYFTGTNLYEYDLRVPSDDEYNYFRQINDKIKDIIWNDVNVRIVHEWQEGDVLVVDLFKMQHAVMGGFDSKDRKFTGIFGAIYPWDQD